MVAPGFRPEVAILCATRATIRVASASPASSCRRKCFRNVFGERNPTVSAIWSCRKPSAAIDRTSLRSSSFTRKLGRAIDHLRLNSRTLPPDLVEAATVLFQSCFPARQLLPALHNHIDVGGTEFEAITHAPGIF